MTDLVHVAKRSADGETLIRSVVPDLRRKSFASALGTRGESDNPRIARNVPITSEHIDGDGDIVRADGLDVTTRYARNPIVMLQHGRTMEFPVIAGRAVLDRTTVDGAPGWVAREFLFGDTVLAREINSLWTDGILNTTSIGFKPIEYFPIDANGKRLDLEDPDALEQMTGFEFTKSLLMEFSIVAIPSNLHAGRELDAILTGKASAYFDLGALRKAVDLRRSDGPVSGAVPRFEPEYVLPKAIALVDKDDSPSDFDASREPLIADSVIVEWAAKFLGVPIQRVAQCDDEVPAARIGSFLASLRDVLAAKGFKTLAVRNLVCDRDRVGREAPPKYEAIQLNSTKHDNFLVEGVSFLKSSTGALVTAVQKTWWGDLEVATYSARSDDGQEVLERSWDLARGANNFLRGEAFALTGKFIPKTAETWDGVFLEKQNIEPLQRAVKRLNEKGREATSRGVIMAGPPGTGKTLSGRVMRNEANATFIWLSSRDFYKMRSGHGAIARAMDMARELAPSIVFFEDIDNWLGGYEIDLLKSELDGIGRHSGVLTCLTTNFPEQLPEALLDRPGRFHDVLRFDLPDETLRRKMLAEWLPSLVEPQLQAVLDQTAGYSGAHLYELAAYAKSIADDDAIGLSEAIDKALTKIREQRELISSRQLAGSRYRPSKAHAEALRTKTSHPAMKRLLAVTEPEPIARVAQLLKAISLERCPGCKGVNLYSREVGSFLEHRSKEGPRCETKALVGEPCGPTVKTIADGIRERTRDEAKLAKDAIPADALALIEALAAIGDMKALAGWAGSVVKEVGELISKAGRVLSAETRRNIETQLKNIEDGIEAATKAIEAMRGAARGLKDFLAAADREDSTPSDEAKASPAGGIPALDDHLRLPRVQAAVASLVAVTR